jgi:hypothetical protein
MSKFPEAAAQHLHAENTLHQLVKELSRLNKATKVAARELIRSKGLVARDAYITRLLELRDEHAMLARQRQHLRAEARLGHPLSAPLSTEPRNEPVLLPTGNPSERLAKLRRTQVIETAKSMFRYGAAGGTSFAVHVPVTPVEVNYEVTISHNWDTYRGSFKGWRANEDNHSIRVGPQWMTKIQRAGLANLSGLMTLDATLIARTETGIEVYSATWARQGRGYSIVTERGFIARFGDEHFHADTEKKALLGLNRKYRSVQQAQENNLLLDISVVEFISKFRDIDCKLTIDDARKTGSCETDIVSWCRSVGIDPQDRSIPLKRALDAFARQPMKEVRLAILRAVRRNRACKRSDNALTS